jgi:predicted nucleic acid-binding protein
MSELVFIDTSALLALAGMRDQYHESAVALARRHLGTGGAWVSTSLVMAELHALLLQRAGVDRARRVVTALLDDPAYEWIGPSADVVRAATSAWLERYTDQRFTLTDAVSFEVMRQKKVTQAFAFDAHFVTAGYTLVA